MNIINASNNNNNNNNDRNNNNNNNNLNDNSMVTINAPAPMNTNVALPGRKRSISYIDPQYALTEEIKRKLSSCAQNLRCSKLQPSSLIESRFQAILLEEIEDFLEPGWMIHLPINSKTCSQSNTELCDLFR